MKLTTVFKFAMIAGVTLFTTAANLAPAQAAKLNFLVTTNDNNQGSFILDTAVINSTPGTDRSTYVNAIQNLTPVFGSESSDLITFRNGTVTTFAFNQVSEFGINYNDGLDFNDAAGNLVNQLSSDPKFYNSNFVAGQYDSMPVSGLTVTDPTAVPEPLTIVGSMAAFGIGLQMKRKMKKST